MLIKRFDQANRRSKMKKLILILSITIGLTIGIRSEIMAANLEAQLEDAAGASGFNVKDSGGTSRFFVKSNGNVGIGTSTPGYSLSVSGSTATNVVVGNYTSIGRMFSGADSVFGHNVYSDTSSRVLKQLVTGYYGTWIRMYYNGGIYFGTSTAAGTAGDTVSNPDGTTNEKMVITNAGNVGIGTISPGYNLDVGNWAINSDTAITPTLRVGGYNILNPDGHYYGSYGGIILSTTGSYNGTKYLITNALNTNKFAIIRGATPTLGLAGALTSGTADFVMDNSGNVGIGITSPSYRLHVVNTSLTSTTVGANILGVFGVGTSGADATLLLSDGASYSNTISMKSGNLMLAPSSGNVGIGTTTPSQKLDVNGIIKGNGGIYGYAGATNNLLIDWATASQITTLTATDLFFGTNANERMRITSGGNVGIGTATPGTYKLYVNGTGYLGAAAWVYSSDKRLKENISYIQSGLNIIRQLKPVKFDYIKGEKKQAGFIAQEVEEILPDIVTKGADGMLGMKTDSIIPYLVKAVQEQQQEIEGLKQEIASLKK
jgi:hypothetical protein